MNTPLKLGYSSLAWSSVFWLALPPPLLASKRKREGWSNHNEHVFHETWFEKHCYLKKLKFGNKSDKLAVRLDTRKHLKVE